MHTDRGTNKGIAVTGDGVENPPPPPQPGCGYWRLVAHAVVTVALLAAVLALAISLLFMGPRAAAPAPRRVPGGHITARRSEKSYTTK
ncbi:hypothetical protein [Mycolicibacterium llatzerense]|uniref:hypothetical protein n=1 Tax=Mycolicibacterium llatzerense TaxID=280871 RepID=UPI0021B6503F|nr:hypothetical protein [Mycolicibacterium llatzerense]